jgi:hypothetical protein
MVAIARKYMPFDRKNAFADDLTLTASDVVQFAAADVELDLGDGYYEGVLVVDVSAIDTVSNDEAYTFILEGCNTSGFGSGDIDALATKRLEDPASAGTPGRQNVEHGVGRFYLPFNNLVDEAQYRYLTLNVIIAGTTPSVTFSAWIAPSSERY